MVLRTLPTTTQSHSEGRDRGAGILIGANKTRMAFGGGGNGSLIKHRTNSDNPTRHGLPSLGGNWPIVGTATGLGAGQTP